MLVLNKCVYGQLDSQSINSIQSSANVKQYKYIKIKNDCFLIKSYLI